ncbi:MAG: pyridoxal-phosphate dependent enzyme [Candidatus Marinimicrobia bacterium]|nr:pyridoxal-phosphate dependent enzyme [Candidatus Neomarinimicrobiota bacterium]
MTIQRKYICSECGKEFEITPKIMVCPFCSKNQKDNEPLRGILEIRYSADGPFYVEELLPIDLADMPDLPVGNTPLWRAEYLDDHKHLYLKDDTGNLTGSFKDRASILVAAFAKKFDINEIVLASTGNAGSSMAGIAAACGIKATIFLPKTAPKAKMVQALQYGAHVVSVDGNYDMAFDLSLEYSKKYKLLSRNTAYNPLTIEGKKSVAIELFRQIGDAPDYVFVPVGDGVILSGVYKGFKDLLQFGFIEKMPTVVAVQAEGSPAIHNALECGSFTKCNSKTIADSIAVDVPRCGYYALKNLQEFKGQSVLVSDDEILMAQKELSKKAGLFAEPAASASYAGYKKSKKGIDANAKVVLLITGSGLKDIEAASQKIKFPEMSIKSIKEIK